MKKKPVNQLTKSKNNSKKKQKTASKVLQTRAGEEDGGINPFDQKGITGPTPYQIGDIDAINVFNGNLTINIPIGNKFQVGGNLSYHFGLHYNLKSWEIRGYHHPETQVGKPVAYVDPFSNMGMGWRLSLDELFAPDTPPYNYDTFRWSLVSADGSKHKFFNTFRPFDNSTAQSDAHGPILFTQDGSFLRLRNHSNGHDKIVESPDGLVRIFNRHGKLRRMNDRFGNFMDISFPNPLTYIIKDNHSRRHEIKFKAFTEPNDDTKTRNLVEYIKLAAFGGKTTSYNFNYEEIEVQRHHRHEHPDVPDTIIIPFLTSIDFEDGSSYRMSHYTSNYQYDPTPGQPQTNVGHVSGLMSEIQLPTGGKYRYTYRAFGFTDYRGEYPSSSSEDGVWEKSVCENNGHIIGKWTYDVIGDLSEIGDPLDPADKEQIRRLVTDPQGNDTIYYFYNKSYDWKHGLPFSIYHSIGAGRNEMFLSKEIFQGSHKRKNKKRSIYVRYTADQLATMGKGNPRVQCQRVVFHDDGNRFVDTKFARYDGLGHFRNKRVISYFSKNKTVFTNYNHSRGNYDFDAMSGSFLRPDSFKQPAPTDAWVLNTHSVVDTFQQGMPKAARKRYYFEWSTGFLRAIRVQGSISSLQSNDLLTVYERDQSGNRNAEKYYGGDLQVIPKIVNYDNLLYALPDPYYQIDHGYQFGVRSRSQYYFYEDSKKNPVSFKSLDQDIDKNTGLTSIRRDISELATTFIYDKMGRLTDVKPKEGKEAFTKYQYSVTQGQTYIYSRKYDNYTSGNPNLVVVRTRYDDFGRPFRDRTAIELQPEEKMSLRETKYNALGWKTSVSEQTFGNTAYHKTKYQVYDPFGRAKKIVSPDGEVVDINYQGIRVIERTQNISTGRNAKGEFEYTLCTTIETYDAYNRLVEVREPSGSLGGYHRTTYDYDYADHLIKVTQYGAGSDKQEREFIYDQRGFLLKEKHPEKGSNGKGWVYYQEYDAKGHAGKIVDGPNKLTYVYDKAERLKLIKETNGRKLKEFVFGNKNEGNNKKLGKLQMAVRYNYGIIPGDNAPYTIPVIEQYQYRGIGGRVSHRNSTIAFNNPKVTDYQFVQNYEYNRLGNIEKLHYPNAVHVPSGNQPRVIAYSYNAGLLSSVREPQQPGQPEVIYAENISYHAYQSVHQIKHSNGVIYTLEKDPHDIPRPRKIVLEAPAWSVSRGPFHYDGAGNIMRIDILARDGGFEDFIYDKVNRLKEHRSDEGWYQQYLFDPFGNISKITTKSDDDPQPDQRYLPINRQTNRLKGTSYDGAGNQKSSVLSDAEYTFDAFNKINGLKAGNLHIAHLYNASEKRIWTASHDKLKNKVSHTFSLRDQEGRLLRQYKVEGSNMNDWKLDRDYIYRGRTVLASNSSSEGIRHFHPDHLGSPLVITDFRANGGGHFYRAFGEELSDPDSDTIPLKFTGHERDSLPNADPLDYMHARFYSPKAAKFLSVDPIRGNRKVPQSWNRYAYAYGNPMRIVDPTGLFGVPALFAGLTAQAVAAQEEKKEQNYPTGPFHYGFVDYVEVVGSAETNESEGDSRPRFSVQQVNGEWVGSDGYVFKNNPNKRGVTIMQFLKEYRDRYGLQGCAETDNSCQVMDKATEGRSVEVLMRLQLFMGKGAKELDDALAWGIITYYELLDTLTTPYDPYEDEY